MKTLYSFYFFFFWWIRMMLTSFHLPPLYLGLKMEAAQSGHMIRSPIFTAFDHNQRLLAVSDCLFTALSKGTSSSLEAYVQCAAIKAHPFCETNSQRQRTSGITLLFQGSGSTLQISLSLQSILLLNEVKIMISLTPPCPIKEGFAFINTNARHSLNGHCQASNPLWLLCRKEVAWLIPPKTLAFTEANKLSHIQNLHCAKLSQWNYVKYVIPGDRSSIAVHTICVQFLKCSVLLKALTSDC